MKQVNPHRCTTQRFDGLGFRASGFRALRCSALGCRALGLKALGLRALGFGSWRITQETTWTMEAEFVLGPVGLV